MATYRGLSPEEALQAWFENRNAILQKYGIDPARLAGNRPQPLPQDVVQRMSAEDRMALTMSQLSEENPQAFRLLQTGRNRVKVKGGTDTREIFNTTTGQWEKHDVKGIWSHPETWVQIALGITGGVAGAQVVAGAPTAAGGAPAASAAPAATTVAGAPAAAAPAAAGGTAAAGTLPATTTVPLATSTVAGGTGAASSVGGASALSWLGGGSTLGNVMNLVQLASGAWSTIGQLRQGRAQNELAQFNASYEEQLAKDTEALGVDEQNRFKQGIRMLIGSQRAAFAGQGVDVNQGSPVDVQADAAYLGQQDLERMRINTAREAWGHRQQAQNYRMGGQNALNASRWGAASTAVGTASSLLQQRYAMRS